MKVDYETYIRSPAWHKIREEFLSCILFEGFCAACGGVPSVYQIHHMTYTRLGQENLEDLVALCDRCHNLLHEYHKSHPKKLNLWRASQQFIQNSRKIEGLDVYLFMPFEYHHKKHRHRLASRQRTTDLGT